jgi:hypothetical protein
MLRTEVIELLLKSYNRRELKALANRLGVEPYVGSHSSGIRAVSSSLYLADAISDILFDPGGSYHDFNKLAEMEA